MPVACQKRRTLSRVERLKKRAQAAALEPLDNGVGSARQRMVVGRHPNICSYAKVAKETTVPIRIIPSGESNAVLMQPLGPRTIGSDFANETGRRLVKIGWNLYRQAAAR